MSKSSTATVIDLEAFRQRKALEERSSEATPTPPSSVAAMTVPVWFCWVPMWTAFSG